MQDKTALGISDALREFIEALRNYCKNNEKHKQ